MCCLLFLFTHYCSCDGRNVTVHCSKQTDNSKCYVSDQIILEAGDRLKFENLDPQHQNSVLEFNITYNSQLPLIPSSIFETFPNLEQLKLSTGLKQLHHNDFEYAYNLYNLTLSDNSIERITNSVFSLAKNLVELNLDGNQLLHLENYAFNGLDKLYYLSLNKNRIITLKSYVFSGAPYLTDLRLENNELETIEDGVFDLPNLLFLYLGYNQLKQLPDNCFANAPLVGLDLRSNHLTHLGNAIYGLKTIQRLILLNNKNIDDLDEKRLAQTSPHLVDLSFDQNATVIERTA